MEHFNDKKKSLPPTSKNEVPLGTITLFGGPLYQDWLLEQGWIVCDGRELNKKEYKALHEVLGNTYGESPEGFNLPNLKDRFVAGCGQEYKLGETGGQKEVTLTQDQMPKHAHQLTIPKQPYTISLTPNSQHQPNYALGTEVRTTSESGGSQPHENRPPYFALYYLIKVR